MDQSIRPLTEEEKRRRRREEERRRRDNEDSGNGSSFPLTDYDYAPDSTPAPDTGTDYSGGGGGFDGGGASGDY